MRCRHTAVHCGAVHCGVQFTVGYSGQGNGSLMYGLMMSLWLTSWRLEDYQGRFE